MSAKAVVPIMASQPENKKDDQPEPQPTSLEEQLAALQRKFGQMEKRNEKVMIEGQ